MEKQLRFCVAEDKTKKSGMCGLQFSANKTHTLEAESMAKALICPEHRQEWLNKRK